jgi:hypothetical protein
VSAEVHFRVVAGTRIHNERGAGDDALIRERPEQRCPSGPGNRPRLYSAFRCSDDLDGRIGAGELSRELVNEVLASTTDLHPKCPHLVQTSGPPGSRKLWQHVVAELCGLETTAVAQNQNTRVGGVNAKESGSLRRWLGIRLPDVNAEKPSTAVVFGYSSSHTWNG